MVFPGNTFKESAFFPWIIYRCLVCVLKYILLIQMTRSLISLNKVSSSNLVYEKHWHWKSFAPLRWIFKFNSDYLEFNDFRIKKTEIKNKIPYVGWNWPKLMWCGYIKVEVIFLTPMRWSSKLPNTLDQKKNQLQVYLLLIYSWIWSYTKRKKNYIYIYTIYRKTFPTKYISQNMWFSMLEMVHDILLF